MIRCRKSPVALAAATLIALAVSSAPASAVTFTWTGGTFNPGTTAPSPLEAPDELNITTGANKIFVGPFTNNSLVTWEAGSMFLGGGALITNNGSWNSQSDTILTVTTGGGSFTNNGSFAKTGGTGSTTIGVAFSNNGTLDAQTGTLLLNGSGISFNNGSVFTGAGAVNVANSSSFNGSFQSSNLLLSNGTQTGTAAVLNGSVDWSASTLAGDWTVASGQALNLIGGGNKIVAGTGTSVVNEGTVSWSGGSVFLGGGAAVVNNGVWNSQSDTILTITTGGGSLTNNGSFAKTGGTGTTTIDVAFSNTGVVDVQVGTIALPSGFNNTGTLTGDGRFTAGSVLTNSGTVAPGSFGVGSLDIGSSFVQTASGVLALDLTSLISFDLLAIANTADLSGTLALNCLGLCSYDVGDSFTVLTSGGARSGTFASLTLSGFATGAFDVIYGANSVSLLVTEAVTPVPEPHTWALMLAGLAAVGSWARRRSTQAAG